jgi:ParB family transcriptional regulator, chromosome partitioning protein
MATTAGAVTETITDIELFKLIPAPWNARKTFDEAKMIDLVNSVREHGIQMPLLVRELEIPEGWNDGPRFEIVAGHRRYLAAKRVEYVTAPCIIRDMTDAEAREIGMVDNLQRDNLPPLEEARGFADLLETPGATVESVAARVGVAMSYVGRRLRLLDAILPVQEALTAGAIEVGHALELARLDSTQQQKLLNYLNCGYNLREVDEDDDDNFDEDDFNDSDLAEDEQQGVMSKEATSQDTQWRPTPKSVAELKREISRTMLRVLSDAPFALEDELAPVACSECPKRTVNSSLLFPDVTQDVCTDRACYDNKVREFIKYNVEHAEEQGKTVTLLGTDYYYDRTSGIVRYQDVKVIDPENGAECESQEEAMWLDGPKAGHRVLFCRNHDCKTHYGSSSRSNSAQNAKEEERQKAERKATLAKVSVQKRYRKSLLTALGQATVLSSTSEALSLDVTEHCIRRMTSIYNGKLAEALGWDASILEYGHGDKLREVLKSMTDAERLRAAHLAIHASELAVQEYSVNSKDCRPDGFEMLAGYLDVDAAGLKAAAVEAQAAKSKPKTKAKPETTNETATTTTETPVETETPAAAKPAKKSAAKKTATKTAKPFKKTTTKKAAKKTAKKRT